MIITLISPWLQIVIAGKSMFCIGRPVELTEVKTGESFQSIHASRDKMMAKQVPRQTANIHKILSNGLSALSNT